MTKINPCRHCKVKPDSGFYPGDFSIECEDCLVCVSRHMVDYPSDNDFDESADLAKKAAIVAWNIQNPKGETSGT